MNDLYIAKLKPLILILTLSVLSLSFASSSSSAVTSPFGIHAGLTIRFRDHYGTRADATQLLADMSAAWTREEFAWEAIEPNPHLMPRQYRWRADGYFDYDEALELAAAHEIQVLGLLSYGPRTNVNTGAVYNAQGLPPDLIPDAAPISAWLPAWRDYVRAVVTRYGDYIDYWEIQNEPNSVGFWRKVDLTAASPSAADYVTVLQAAYEVIQEVNPGDKIVLGGLSYEGYNQGVDYYDYLWQIYEAGGWPYFDILAFHPYRWPAFPEQVLPRTRFDVRTRSYQSEWLDYNYTDEIQAFNTLMAGWGAKPLWITEIGWPVAALAQRASERNTQPEIVQSDYLIRAYVQSIAAGVENIFWYDFRDDYWVENDPNESSFGLVRGDFSPKPAYHAFGVMASLLGNSRFVEQVRGQADRNRPGDDDVYEYRFAGNSRTVIVLWKSQGGDIVREVAVENIPVATVHVYGPDFTSNISRTLESVENTITLDLTERPVFVVYHEPTFWEELAAKIGAWFDEQWRIAEEKLDAWWAEQQIKLEQWWQAQTEALLRQIEIEIERQLAQLCGAVLLPLVLVWTSVVLRKKYL